MYLQQRRDHRGHAVRAVDALRRHAHRGGVEGRRAGLRDRRLPAPPGRRCARRARFQRVVPGVRRRSRPRPPRGAGRASALDAAERADDPPRTGRRRSGRRSPASTSGPTHSSSGSAATRVADPCSTTASRLGDFSLIWHPINVARGVTGGPRRRRRSRCWRCLLGAESLLVNQGIKRLFHRHRPTVDGDERFPVRRRSRRRSRRATPAPPAFAATVLTAWDGRERAAVVADRRHRRHLARLRPHPPRVRRRRRAGRGRDARRPRPTTRPLIRLADHR